MLSLSPSVTLSDASAESSGGSGFKRTLLIVDDEEGPRQSLWAIFKDDYRILLADSGQKAIALTRENHIDAAVLDIRMPDFLGTDLLAELKKIDPAIEVVMLTAYQTVETARQALRHGACEYLAKPFDIGAMCDAVANAMERRAISDQIRSNSAQLRELQLEIRQQRLQNEVARSKGEIYGSILHDINNPLSVVSGLIDMMNSQVTEAPRLEGQDLARLKSRLAQMNRQLTNCIQITRRYLSFLRPRSESNAIVSVNQVLADLSDLIEHHPGLGKNEVIIDPLQVDFSARVNGLDLIQILLNLTVNALQSTVHPHTVRLNCQVLDRPLDLAAAAREQHSRVNFSDGFANEAPLVEISVVDDGVGIPPQILDRLFEPYFTTRAPGQGTGLGLAIVQRLIAEAKGAIRVQSDSGHGARFSIYLPGEAQGSERSG